MIIQVMYSPISFEPFAVALFTPNKEDNLGHHVYSYLENSSTYSCCITIQMIICMLKVLINGIKITVYMHITKQWCKGVGCITTTTHGKHQSTDEALIVYQHISLYVCKLFPAGFPICKQAMGGTVGV